MNCIFLLLLLSCCGFGCGGNGSCSCNGNNPATPASAANGSGCGCGGSQRTGNGMRGNNGFPTVGNGYGCEETDSPNDNDCGCPQNCGNGDGNPPHWKDYPGLSGREGCGCEE